MNSFEGLKPASVDIGAQRRESAITPLQQDFVKGGLLGERLAALAPEQLEKIDRAFFQNTPPSALRHITTGNWELYEHMLMAINGDERVSIAQVRQEIEDAIDAAQGPTSLAA